MNYTNEEKQIIKNNIKKIEEYCKTEILPKMRGSLSISFFETQYRSDGSAFRKTYGFHIDTKGTPTFTSSALRIVLDENHEGGSTSVNAYESIHYTVELFERWQTIKAKIHEELIKAQATRSALLSFEI